MQPRRRAARTRASGPQPGPASTVEPDPRFDWSPYDAPPDVFDEPLAWDRVVQDLLDVYFSEWWGVPGRHPAWLSMPAWEGPDDILAWWDLGEHSGSTCRSPRIEVAGECPPDGVGLDLPESVRLVGWWVVAGISFEEAQRWASVDVTHAAIAHRWARLMGEDLQVSFPGHCVAKHCNGRWSPTAAGLSAFRRFDELGVRDDHFRFDRSRYLAAAAEGSLDKAFDLLRSWMEVARLLPIKRPSEVPVEALYWLSLGLDIQEARDWALLAGTTVHEVAGWRRQGFTPFGASLWRQGDDDDDPVAARSLHLQLFGEDNGLGPMRRGSERYAWRPPLTAQQKRDRRRARWIGRWHDLVWTLKGRPG
jgi:hypothetical protein